MSRVAGASIAIAAVAAALSGADARARAVADPRVAVTKLTPLVVVGTGFRAREAVLVAVRSDEGRRASRRTTANAAGSIVVRFRTLSLTSCSGYLVTARGGAGSRAQARGVPRPCGIDPRPDP